MDIASYVNRFSALRPDQQATVLAKFGHELTIAARDTYVVGAPGLTAPDRLRAINETQHRVLGHIDALLTNRRDRYPDDVIIGILLTHEDESLRAQAKMSLDRSFSALESH